VPMKRGEGSTSGGCSHDADTSFFLAIFRRERSWVPESSATVAGCDFMAAAFTRGRSYLDLGLWS